MPADRFLFILDVERIQDYIFSTNKLKSIIGASSLLDEIISSPEGATLRILSEPKYGFSKGGQPITTSPNFILSGGGNTKVIFEGGDSSLPQDFERRISKVYSDAGISVTTHMEALSAGKTPEQVSLINAERTVARKKYSKIGSTSIAGSPFFKICETCGREYAVETEGHGENRKLVCEVCKTKFEHGTSSFRLLSDFTFITNIEDLTLRGGIIAVVVMDGNCMGEKVKNLGSFADLKTFSEKTELIFSNSFQKTLEKIFPNEFQMKSFCSIRPIIMGGDDICFIVAAEKAMPFVTEFTNEVMRRSTENDTATKYFGEEGISLSTGMVYMKRNYPFNFAHRIAESLLRSAKSASRDQDNCSMVDFNVMLTSCADEIEKTRAREYAYDNNIVLTRRPYPHAGLDQFSKDVVALKKALARNKIKYLRQALRLGVEGSTVELLKILARLPQNEKGVFKRIIDTHGWARDADGYWRSGLLDLVEMADFTD